MKRWFQFGTQFYEKVYNETVNIVEVEEGLDGETFFLYVFLGAGVVLLLVIGQQFLYSVGKKRVGGTKKNLQLETGTKKKDDIDYEWVPPHLLKTFSKSLTKFFLSKSSFYWRGMKSLEIFMIVLLLFFYLR